MKEYKIAVAYTEGCIIYIDAENENEASEKAQELFNNEASVRLDTVDIKDTVHRETIVADISEY